MRKNWLAAAWTHWFRPRPVVPDAAFQDEDEPYPGHWRRFPEPWSDSNADEATREAEMAERARAADSALGGLPPLWRRIVTARAAARGDDREVADRFGLTLRQERDILARARAAVRDRLDRTRTGGEG